MTKANSMKTQVMISSCLVDLEDDITLEGTDIGKFQNKSTLVRKQQLIKRRISLGWQLFGKNANIPEKKYMTNASYPYHLWHRNPKHHKGIDIKNKINAKSPRATNAQSHLEK